MPLFSYESFNRSGDRVKGSIDASSLQAAKELLQGQGLMPTKISEVAAEGSGFSFKTLFEKKIDNKTVILFTRQLAVMLRSSIPLLQSLELLLEQFDGKFRRVLVRIKDDVKGGQPLAKALARYPSIFVNVYVQLVKAGEASGKLDQVLRNLADYLERTEETKKQIKKAMSYPMIVLSFAGVVVFGLLTVLVPKIKGIFAQMGKELPEPTVLLIAMSDGLRENYVMIFAVATALFLLFKYWVSSPAGKAKLDELMLRLPMTAYFSRTKAVVQFSKTLGLLLESGVNLSEALDIVCNIVDNKVLTQKLIQARDNIIKEGKIAKFLGQTGIFPGIATYMISTGEQSGKLPEMLLTVGNDYEGELRELTGRLTEAINPIVMVVLACTIGFILVSMYLPMISMGDIAGGM